MPCFITDDCTISINEIVCTGGVWDSSHIAATTAPATEWRNFDYLSHSDIVMFYLHIHYDIIYPWSALGGVRACIHIVGTRFKPWNLLNLADGGHYCNAQIDGGGCAQSEAEYHFIPRSINAADIFSEMLEQKRLLYVNDELSASFKSNPFLNYLAIKNTYMIREPHSEFKHFCLSGFKPVSDE